MQVGTIQHSEVRPLASRLALRLAQISDEVGPFRTAILQDNRGHRLVCRLQCGGGGLLITSRFQGHSVIRKRAAAALGEHWRILIDDGESRLQDRSDRTPVLFQHHTLGRREISIKEFEGLTRCPTESVNRLVRIAHRKQIPVGTRQAGQNLDLREVGVLEFIGKDVPGATACLGQHRLIAVQQGVRPRDHMAEGPEVFFREPALDRREYAGNLPASAQYLLIIKRNLGLHHPWNRDFAPFDAFDIVSIFLRRHQFVVTPVHEVQQVIEELPDVGSSNVVLQTQVVDAPPQINPEVLLIEHAEIFTYALQQFQAVIVKGQSLHDFSTQQLAYPLLHFLGGINRISQGKNLVGAGMPFLHQPLDAMGQNRRLTRAGSSDDQHRTVDVFDRFTLALVRNKGSRTEIRLQRHCGQDITCRDEKACAELFRDWVPHFSQPLGEVGIFRAHARNTQVATLRSDPPERFRMYFLPCPRNTPASRYSAQQIWARRRFPRLAQWFSQSRRNLQPQANTRTHSCRSAAAEFWQAAAAVHLSTRQFRYASKAQAIPGSHQTSSRTPGNRNVPPVPDRRPVFRNRCVLCS